MRSCSVIRPAGSFELEKHRVIYTLVLNAQDRHLRRKVLKISDDVSVLVDLPNAVMLAAGDGLELENGELVLISADDEPLMEVRAGGKLTLTQLAWHIGNRHLPAQVEQDRILLERDHVIAAMLNGLGATTTDIVEPFLPLQGAYHGHSHGNAHGH